MSNHLLERSKLKSLPKDLRLEVEKLLAEKFPELDPKESPSSLLDDLMRYVYKAKEEGARPDSIVLSPSNWVKFRQQAYPPQCWGINAGRQGEEVEVSFIGMKVEVSSLLEDDDFYILDSKIQERMNYLRNSHIDGLKMTMGKIWEV